MNLGCAALTATEAAQRAVLDAALDCVIRIDDRGRVTYFNESAERTFGYGADEAVGQELADVILPPSYRDAHRRGLARYLETGAANILDRRIELTAIRRDGTIQDEHGPPRSSTRQRTPPTTRAAAQISRPAEAHSSMNDSTTVTQGERHALELP